MKGHSRLLTRTWLVTVAAAVLVVGHIVLPYVLSHTALPATVVSGVIVLMVVKHLGLLAGLLGPLRAHFRRR